MSENDLCFRCGAKKKYHPIRLMVNSPEGTIECLEFQLIAETVENLIDSLPEGGNLTFIPPNPSVAPTGKTEGPEVGWDECKKCPALEAEVSRLREIVSLCEKKYLVLGDKEIGNKFRALSPPSEREGK